MFLSVFYVKNQMRVSETHEQKRNNFLGSKKYELNKLASEHAHMVMNKIIPKRGSLMIKEIPRGGVMNSNLNFSHIFISGAKFVMNVRNLAPRCLLSHVFQGHSIFVLFCKSTCISTPFVEQ